MIPRVELIARTMSGTKYDLAKAAPCHQRTAQRVWKKLHKERVVTVIKWVQHYRHMIPVYGQGTTQPKPKPKTRAQISKKYMNDTEHKIQRLMRDRANRIIKRYGI